jgi:adenylate cyclase
MEDDARSIDRASPALRIAMRAIEILYSLVVLAWIAVPAVPSLAAYLPGLMPTPYLPFGNYSGGALPTAYMVAIGTAVGLPGLIALFKLISPFLSRKIPSLADPTRSWALCLSVLESAPVLAAIGYYVFEYARSARFFLSTSPANYAVAGASLLFNAFSLYRLIVNAGYRDEDYREYLAYRHGPGKAAMRDAGLTHGIQKKLVFSFLPLILAIVVVLSLVLMASFRTTIQSSIIESGRRLAGQAADVIKSNPADMIAVDDYLLIEAKKNELSSVPFRELDYLRRDPAVGDFAVAASTAKPASSAAAAQAAPAPSTQGAGSAPAARAAPAPAKRLESFSEPFYEYEAASNAYVFYAPVLLSRAYIGYVRVEYDRDVIFEPYFRTLVRAVAFAAIFIYIGALLIYLIGRNIVIPILYLRMSVASISSSLAGMVKGSSRISSDLLQYKDRVVTRDEIKGLSNEVGNMTTVLRGIVPYISANTLKHSERVTPMNETRELCFMFTDIRGFTTLCEGMEPEEVVTLLNRYLELQSSIIFGNGGDVDKFVGDEVMAVFEGPEKEIRAAKTGLDIMKAMEDERRKAKADRKKSLAIGIGINSGKVVFGSIGAKDRMDFTSIGDAVNLAARLEGANKAYGTKALISDVVYEQAKGLYLCREVDRLIVKGKSQPVSVYELVARRDDAGADDLERCDIFEKALAAYRKRSWERAEKAFAFLREKYKDELSATFLQRVSHFKRNPPPEAWDGVFTLAVK